MCSLRDCDINNTDCQAVVTGKGNKQRRVPIGDRGLISWRLGALHLLGLHAPYAWSSLPVVLGSVGGIGLLVGPAGLLWLNLRRHEKHGDPAQRGMDRGFIALLLLTSLSGFALLALREAASMPFWIAVHLGIVMALFLTLPYGKFAHGVFRLAALLKYAIEKRLPNRLALGSD